MGAPDLIELVGLVETNHLAIFVTTDGLQRQSRLGLSLTPEEWLQFREALTLRPFGESNIHHVFLRSLQQGMANVCVLRIASAGSRHETKVQVSKETFIGLEYIFNQFALDPDLVPERPSCVCDIALPNSPNA